MMRLIRSVSDHKLFPNRVKLNRNSSKDKTKNKSKLKRKSRKNIKSHANIKYMIQEPPTPPQPKLLTKTKLTIDTSQEVLGSAEEDKFVESGKKEHKTINQNTSNEQSSNSFKRELKFKQRQQNVSNNFQGSQGVDSSSNFISKEMSSIVSNEEYLIKDNDFNYNKKKGGYMLKNFNEDLGSTQKEYEENKYEYNDINFMQAFEQIREGLRKADSDYSSEHNIPNEFDTESSRSNLRSRPNFNEFVRLDDLNDLSSL